MKKILSVILSLIMILSAITLTATATPAPQYTDLYTDSVNGEPKRIATNKTTDIIINPSMPVTEIGLDRYWASNPANDSTKANAILKISVYEFNGTYDLSVTQTPVAQAQTTIAGDYTIGTTTKTVGTNCTMFANGGVGVYLVFDEPLEAGQYIVRFEDAATSGDHYFYLPSADGRNFGDNVVMYSSGSLKTNQTVTMRVRVAGEGELSPLLAAVTDKYTWDAGSTKIWLSSDSNTAGRNDRTCGVVINTEKDIRECGLSEYWASRSDAAGQSRAVLKITVYSFDKNYKSTKSNEPVAYAQATISGDKGNDNFIVKGTNCSLVVSKTAGAYLYFRDPLPAGQYLVEFSDVSEESGDNYLVIPSKNTTYSGNTAKFYINENVRTDYTIRLRVGLVADGSLLQIVEDTDNTVSNEFTGDWNETAVWLTSGTGTNGNTARTYGIVVNSDKAIRECGLDQYWASNPNAEGQNSAVIKIAIYKFTKNYAVTTAGTPVAWAQTTLKGDKGFAGTVTTINRGTNCTMVANDLTGTYLYFKDPLPAGQYIVEISEVSDATDNHYLVLPSKHEMFSGNNAKFYINGNLTTDYPVKLRVGQVEDGSLLSLENDAAASDVYTASAGDVIFNNSYWLSNENSSSAGNNTARSFGVMINPDKAILEVGLDKYWASRVENGDGQAYATVKITVYKFFKNYNGTKNGAPVAYAQAVLAGDTAFGTITRTKGTNCSIVANGNVGAYLIFDEPLQAGQYLVEFSEVSEDNGNHYLLLPYTEETYGDNVKFYLNGTQINDLTAKVRVGLAEAGTLKALESDEFIKSDELSANVVIKTGGKMDVNIKMDKALYVCGAYTGYYMTFNGSDKQVKATAAADKYAFTYSDIDPDQMNDELTAVLHAADTEATLEISFNVTDYCTAALNDAAATDTLKALLVDMLNYGAAAQAYAGSAAAPANDGLTEQQKVIAEPDLANADSYQLTELSGAPVKWTAVGLRLEDEISIRYTFKVTDTVSNPTISFSDASNNTPIATATLDDCRDAGNCVYVYYLRLPVNKMRTVINATVYDGNNDPVSSTLRYSIASYAARQIDKLKNSTATNDVALVKLLKTMMNYGDAAAAYVAE